MQVICKARSTVGWHFAVLIARSSDAEGSLGSAEEWKFDKSLA